MMMKSVLGVFCFALHQGIHGRHIHMKDMYSVECTWWSVLGGVYLVECTWWSVLGGVYLVEYTNDDRHQRRLAANNDKPTHLNGSLG